MEKNDQSAKLIRWTARISGTALVVLTLVFGIGNLLDNTHNQDSATIFSTSLIITFIFWGIGLVGLVWALWNEKIGGILSFVSFVVFMLMAVIGSGNKSAGVLIIFLIPSILYLTYWQKTRKG